MRNAYKSFVGKGNLEDLEIDYRIVLNRQTGW
jgi:hypothetical protein